MAVYAPLSAIMTVLILKLFFNPKFMFRHVSSRVLGNYAPIRPLVTCYNMHMMFSNIQMPFKGYHPSCKLDNSFMKHCNSQ